MQFSPLAQEHGRALRKRDQQILLDAIATQLTHQPDRPTKKRKHLEQNRLAPWELRVGSFRVFYDVDLAQGRVVVAVGEKTRNILRIGGEELQL